MKYPIHKIINFKKIMTPNNIVCNTQANHVVGTKYWKNVTCSKCLRKKAEGMKDENGRRNIQRY